VHIEQYQTLMVTGVGIVLLCKLLSKNLVVTIWF